MARRLDVEYWDDLQLNLWWKKKKLYELGYGKWRKEAYKIEGTDPITGKTDTLVPLGGTLHLCEDCFRKLHSYEYLRVRMFFSTHPVKCDLCGKPIFVGYKIIEGRVSLHTLWYVLGKKKHALKADGEYIV